MMLAEVITVLFNLRHAYYAKASACRVEEHGQTPGPKQSGEALDDGAGGRVAVADVSLPGQEDQEGRLHQQGWTSGRPGHLPVGE